MQRYSRLRIELEELRSDLDAMSTEVFNCTFVFADITAGLFE